MLTVELRNTPKRFRLIKGYLHGNQTNLSFRGHSNTLFHSRDEKNLESILDAASRMPSVLFGIVNRNYGLPIGYI